MQMNDVMRRYYDSIYRSCSVFPDSLTTILASGFMLEENCVFLRSLYLRKGNASRALFTDDVGYECFVNHIHVDEHATVYLLPVAVQFGQLIGAAWQREALPGDLRVIVTYESDNCVIRFHLKRPNQSWICDDIESYGDIGVLILDFRKGENGG